MGLPLFCQKSFHFYKSCSEKYDIIVMGVVDEVWLSQAFTGGLVWFGLHSSLVGFGFDKFSQINLCCA